MTTLAADLDTAYRQGYTDAVDQCATRHLDHIADVLDAIHRHAGDIEQQRTAVLDALGHGGPS